MVKKTIHPGGTDIIIVDIPNKRALKSIKQNWWGWRNRWVYNFIRDFNITLSTVNKLDLADTHRRPQLIILE